MQKKEQWQCRWSPTLGALEDTHQKIWGTKDYKNDTDPTVFFGLYGLPDFYALWRHKGRRCILWAGTDIAHFKNGYWLDDKGEICLDYIPLAEWINKNCESYVENEVEQQALADCFIGSKIVPSFLGNINDYPISFKAGNKVYTSVSGDNFEQYGWYKIPELAAKNPNIEFHCYGNKAIPFEAGLKNIIIHGRVSKEQMNAEIKEMQGALRLTEFDGFSEILAKSVLWGQHPISPFIKYECTLSSVADILKMKTPNIEGQLYYRRILNKYPWVTK